MNAIKKRIFSFSFCRSCDEPPRKASRFSFRKVWNVAALLLSSLLLNTLSLCLAFGTYDWGIFYGYLSVPSIFVLNWIPILFIQLLLYCLIGRNCFAFIFSALIFILPSIGNFFKLKFRSEPFTFRDLSSIGAAFKIAGNYDLSVNHRILLAIVLVAGLFLFLLFFARGKPSRGFRICAVLVIVLSIYPLWRFVYSNGKLYHENTVKNNYLGSITEQDCFIQNGFVYPFLYSITQSHDIPPEGYDEESAQAILAQYADATIPAGQKVNIMVMQLESFTDLEQMGVTGISSDAYAVLRQLQQESLSGTLFSNVIGGGTIDTERCFLSGSYGLQTYYSDSPSYVRYLSAQGYYTTGSHVNRADFYNRVNINRYLGFDEYYFTNNYYEQLMDDSTDADELLIKEAFRMFIAKIVDGQNVFSFNVTISGHSPYNRDKLDCDQLYWQGEQVSDLTRNVINNYLFSIAKTQQYLIAEIEQIRDFPEPVVLLIYGDHPPYLESSQVYNECGIDINMSTENGVMNYYSTPYLIWANDSAKAALNSEFSGQAPTISPGYLMNVLFDTLGWKGSAFMQFTSDVMNTLPLVSTNGYFIENGEFARVLSSENAALLHDYECVQFWLRSSLN